MSKTHYTVDEGIEIQVETNDEGLPVQFHKFPKELILIFLGGSKYAANNGTTPEGVDVNGLATFMNSEEALIYQEKCGLTGDLVRKTFAEARDIALSKTNIQALFLMIGTSIADIHYVR